MKERGRESKEEQASNQARLAQNGIPVAACPTANNGRRMHFDFKPNRRFPANIAVPVVIGGVILTTLAGRCGGN